MISFGTFEVDLQAGELRKQGRKIKLQEKPLLLLSILLERPGEVVTREELQKRLWPEDTFVDFDQGLNTAVAKLRHALDDPSDNPRFVETVPRRGYCFLAPVRREQIASEPLNALRIYPTTDSVPLNLLKMTLEFDHPMDKSRSFDHLSFYSEGEELGLPFLDLQTELWNLERTRLTLWLDPGRIKQGLIPNERDGNPLKSERIYRFQLDR